MEYFSLFIPVALIAVLFFFFRSQTAIWEYFIPTVSTIVVVLCMRGCMQYSRTTDTEFLTEKITQCAHEDPWDEEVSCRHEIPCSHPKYCEDDKGKEYQCGYEHSNDGYYHLYDVDYHADEWYYITESGKNVSVSQSYYNKLRKEWNNESFVEMNRRNVHSIDGDKQVTNWTGEFALTETHTWEKSYENKVQASDNIVNFPSVDTSDVRRYALYEYPSVSTLGHRFILSNGFYVSQADQDYLRKVNAHIGPTKQCQIFVLLFKNKSPQSALMQKRYWKGGNMNEFIICIGVDDLGNIEWNENITWCEKPMCDIQIRDFVLGQKKLNLSKLSDFALAELKTDFKRKDFKKDFDYLQIELTHGQVSGIYWTIVILNILMGIWIVMNEFGNDDVQTTSVAFFNRRRSTTSSRNRFKELMDRFNF